MRGQRIFLAAMLLSLMAHLIVAGSASEWWTAPAPEIPFPIEARLNLAAEPAPPVAVLSSSPSAKTRLPAATEEVVAPTPEPPPSGLPHEVVAAAPQQVTEPVQPVAVPPVQTPAAPEPAAPAQAPPRGLRNLPERIALRYSVQSGEDGFSIGQTTYSGQFRDGRYSLVSVTEATGITALFVSGKIIQTSEGRVTPNGLQPEQFWNVKGGKRQLPVRFDWVQQRLLLPGGSVELAPQTQDLMSFPFHLAMLVRDEDAEWTLPVTNGKKLREYGFRVIGREQLAAGDSRIETLHLQGGRSGEGSLDVWLAPTRNWLPVRIRMLDQKGKVIVLTLQDAPN
jgi:hypothetical protein